MPLDVSFHWYCKTCQKGSQSSLENIHGGVQF